MPSSTPNLPQLHSRRPFLTEGGLETALVYQHGYDLPSFASWPLLSSPAGCAILRELHSSYVHIAQSHQTGIVLETQTWRASEPWMRIIAPGEDPKAKVRSVTSDTVALLKSIRAELATELCPIVISGCLGPLGDAYKLSATQDLQVFTDGYAELVRCLADAGVDMLSLMTTSNIVEATAAATLAREAGLPILISFGVETDGALLGGMPLEEAIAQVDAATGAYPVYFGVNCAHPEHFLPVLRRMDARVRGRIGCLRANSSQKSHAELDNSATLDRGDVAALARTHTELLSLLPGLKVVGGCCGTDEEHVSAIADVVLGPA
ncbi:hypothetical protein BP6252_02122 [Coleophoma cylindrospora]|uniref:Hcy-binding domain-containing protein n=1 Tax=Coleophoma cylindrospora TaxID=1849047 RepID=A0A3D8SDY7_9HELO|nr:hypothetical protein BP6252_02122 [Coleophoma cylindrospora]